MRCLQTAAYCSYIRGLRRLESTVQQTMTQRFLSADEKATLRRRILLLFRLHNPSQLHRISPLVDAATNAEATMEQLVAACGGSEPPFYVATTEEREALSERLCAFYSKHEPGKLPSVPTLVARYIDMPDELFEALAKKYNVPSMEQVHAFKQRLRVELTARCPEMLHQLDRLAEEYVEDQDVFLDELHRRHPVVVERSSAADAPGGSPSQPQEGTDGPTAQLPAALPTTTVAPVTTGVAPPNDDPPPPAAPANTYRHRMVCMYSRYDPLKLPHVDSLLLKYAGMEDKMMAALVAKYGPEPDPSKWSDEHAESRARARLERFFKHYNPEKLGTIPKILAAYEGEYDALFQSLEAKYGPERDVPKSPSAATPVDTAPPSSARPQPSGTPPPEKSVTPARSSPPTVSPPQTAAIVAPSSPVPANPADAPDAALAVPPSNPLVGIKSAATVDTSHAPQRPAPKQRRVTVVPPTPTIEGPQATTIDAQATPTQPDAPDAPTPSDTAMPVDPLMPTGEPVAEVVRASTPTAGADDRHATPVGAAGQDQQASPGVLLASEGGDGMMESELEEAPTVEEPGVAEVTVEEAEMPHDHALAVDSDGHGSDDPSVEPAKSMGHGAEANGDSFGSEEGDNRTDALLPSGDASERPSTPPPPAAPDSSHDGAVAAPDVQQDGTQPETMVPEAAHVTPDAASVAEFHRRIHRLFACYDPEKLPSLPTIFAKYRGMEEKLLVAVVQKYGPEPMNTPKEDVMGVEATGDESQSRDEIPPQQEATDTAQRAGDTGSSDAAVAFHEASSNAEAHEDPAAPLAEKAHTEGTETASAPGSPQTPTSADQVPPNDALGNLLRSLEAVLETTFPDHDMRGILRLCLWRRCVDHADVCVDEGSAEWSREHAWLRKELTRHVKLVKVLVPLGTTDDNEEMLLPRECVFSGRVLKFLLFDVAALDEGGTTSACIDRGAHAMWRWCPDEELVMDLLCSLSGVKESHDVSERTMTPDARTEALDGIVATVANAAATPFPRSRERKLRFFLRVHDLECVATALADGMRGEDAPHEVDGCVPPGSPRRSLEAMTASAWRERIVRLLRFHCPSRVATVDALLRGYRGEEAELLQKLVHAYGTEPQEPATEDDVLEIRQYLLWLYSVYDQGSTEAADRHAAFVASRVDCILDAFSGSEHKLKELLQRLPQPPTTADASAAPQEDVHNLAVCEGAAQRDINGVDGSSVVVSDAIHAPAERGHNAECRIDLTPRMMLLVSDEERVRSGLEMEVYNAGSTLRSMIRSQCDEAAVMDWLRQTQEAQKRSVALHATYGF